MKKTISFQVMLMDQEEPVDNQLIYFEVDGDENSPAWKLIEVLRGFELAQSIDPKMHSFHIKGIEISSESW